MAAQLPSTCWTTIVSYVRTRDVAVQVSATSRDAFQGFEWHADVRGDWYRLVWYLCDLQWEAEEDRAIEAMFESDSCQAFIHSFT